MLETEPPYSQLFGAFAVASPDQRRKIRRTEERTSATGEFNANDLEPIMLDTPFCSLTENEWLHMPLEEAKARSPRMHSFPPSQVKDWKHVIYNLLVENYNSEDKDTLVQPFEVLINGTLRKGFKFNQKHNPGKKLAELYTLHMRHARLDLEDQNSVFVQDLYKFYLRSAFQLLAQYFEKYDQYTYLYTDEALFVPGESLEEANARIKRMGTRTRKKGKVCGAL